MKEIIRADKQLIVTTVHYTTHSIYHAHYVTALREVLRCSEVLPVERGHRVRPHKIRFPVVSDFRDDPWDPLNRAKIKSCQIGLTEHTASHLGECSGCVGLFGIADARCSCIAAPFEYVAYVTMTSVHDVAAGESRQLQQAL